MASASTQDERTATEGAEGATDKRDAEADTGGGGFKMMRKARGVAKDAAIMSKDAAKSAKRSTRRFSLEGTLACLACGVSFNSHC